MVPHPRMQGHSPSPTRVAAGRRARRGRSSWRLAAAAPSASIETTGASGNALPDKISFRQDLSSKANVKQAKIALVLGASRAAAQLVDREVFQEWSQPLDHVGEGFESGRGIAELAAGSHRLEQGGGLGGLRREGREQAAQLMSRFPQVGWVLLARWPPEPGPGNRIRCSGRCRLAYPGALDRRRRPRAAYPRR